MLIHTDKKAYVVFSLWLRIFHWTMVLSVTALFWTGLYIGDPGFAAITGHPEPTFAIDAGSLWRRCVVSISLRVLF